MKHVKFNKERSSGEIIDAVFAFSKQNYLDVLKVIWNNNAVIIVALLLSSVFYFYTYSYGALTSNNFFKQLINNLSNTTSIVSLVLYYLLSFIFYPRFYVSVMSYIKVYMKNNGIVNHDKVKELINKNYLKFIKQFFIVGVVYISLIVFIGFSFSIAGPQGVLVGMLGVISIILSVYFGILMITTFTFSFFEKKSLIASYKLSSKFMSNNWWKTLGTLIIVFLLSFAIESLINVPLFIYSFLKGISGSLNVDFVNSGDYVINIFSVISQIAQYLTKILYFIAFALIHFSNIQFHTMSEVIKKINKIGAKQNNSEINSY